MNRARTRNAVYEIFSSAVASDRDTVRAGIERAPSESFLRGSRLSASRILQGLVGRVSLRISGAARQAIKRVTKFLRAVFNEPRALIILPSVAFAR